MKLSVRVSKHERPRERLLRHGAAALQNAELLAIGLRTGAPGLETALLGKAEGDRFSVTIEPADAYGDRNPELIQRVTRKMLAEHAGADATFEPGDLVEFAAPNGGRYSGVLKEINEESALFDFNHPLAGVRLRVDVALLGVL